MKKTIKTLLASLICISLCISLTVVAFSHSGRTDSSGGHKDNKNVSGLGYYHYHCGGYPAHLHDGGYCPYTDVFPSSVNITVEKNTLVLGESIDISAAVYPANSCNTSVHLETSDSDVIALKDGKLTAVGCGTATITATSFNDKVSSITITVNPIEVEEVNIPDCPVEIDLGESITLEAIVTPADATYPEITWESSDDSILTVESDGKLTAISIGNATITATAKNGISTSISIDVVEVIAESIEIIGEDHLLIGSQAQLSVEFTPENTTEKDVIWLSDNNAVLSVDEDGIITAHQIGTAVITAQQKDTYAKIEITVEPIAVTEVQILTTIPEDIHPGDMLDFSAAVLPEDATYPAITWSTSDESIATIDENGHFEAHSRGTVVITATADGISDYCELKVTTPPIVIGLSIFGVWAIAGVSVGSVVLKKSRAKKNNAISESTIEVETNRVCSRCGAQSPANSLFCSSCGNKLD